MILQAIARGYCTSENRNKVLDVTLCLAMAEEIKKLLEKNDVSKG